MIQRRSFLMGAAATTAALTVPLQRVMAAAAEELIVLGVEQAVFLKTAGAQRLGAGGKNGNPCFVHIAKGELDLTLHDGGHKGLMLSHSASNRPGRLPQPQDTDNQRGHGETEAQGEDAPVKRWRHRLSQDAGEIHHKRA